ncbi:hypothetical protein ACPCXA_05180 [Lysinibacillus agricola]
MVDFRSDWALCRFVADASLSRRASFLGRPMSRLGQRDVGHEGVITGRDVLSLRSSITDPQGVASLHSNQPISMAFILMIISTTFGDEPIFIINSIFCAIIKVIIICLESGEDYEICI